MKKALVFPVILIVIFLFIALPLIFWFVSNRYSNNPSVKGLSVREKGNGFLIVINSKYGSWELNEYLCETFEECKSSLTSGTLWGTVGGGTGDGGGDGHEIVVEKSDGWKAYKYLKVFVKPSWGASERTFSAGSVSGSLGVVKYSAIVENQSFNVVIAPLDILASDTFDLVEYSD